MALKFDEVEDDRPLPRRKRVKRSDKPFRVDERWIMTKDENEFFVKRMPFMFEFRERNRFRTREEADRFVAKLERESLSHRRERRIVDESGELDV